MNIEIGVRIVEIKVLKTVYGDIDLSHIINEMHALKKKFSQGYSTVTMPNSVVRAWLLSTGVLRIMSSGSDTFRQGEIFNEVLELLSDEYFSNNLNGVH